MKICQMVLHLVSTEKTVGKDLQYVHTMFTSIVRKEGKARNRNTHSGGSPQTVNSIIIFPAIVMQMTHVYISVSLQDYGLLHSLRNCTEGISEWMC